MVRKRRRLVRRIGKYEYSPHSLLGSGDFGMVYRGFDVDTNLGVAVKVPYTRHDPDFLKEMKLMAHMSAHPNVCAMLHGSELHCVMFMELCTTNLYDTMVNEDTPLNTRALFGDIVAGLHHLHAACRVAHRDLKADNVLLVEGRAKICDFGLAICVPDATRTLETTRRGFLGTITHAAPEVHVTAPAIYGSAEDEPRSYDPFVADVWSAGIILWEMMLVTTLYTEATSKCDLFRSMATHQATWRLGKERGVAPPSIVLHFFLTRTKELPLDPAAAAAVLSDERKMDQFAEGLVAQRGSRMDVELIRVLDRILMGLPTDRMPLDALKKVLQPSPS